VLAGGTLRLDQAGGDLYRLRLERLLSGLRLTSVLVLLGLLSTLRTLSILGPLGPGCRDRKGRGVVGDLGLGAYRPGGLEAAQHGVLGSHDHEGGAEEGVGAGGVDAQRRILLSALTGPGHGEGHLGALGAADPVALHELDLLGPVHGVQVLGEAGAAAARLPSAYSMVLIPRSSL